MKKRQAMTRKELLRTNNKEALKLSKPTLNSPLEKTRREPKEEKDKKNKVFV
jgi:hypothetical protein